MIEMLFSVSIFLQKCHPTFLPQLKLSVFSTEAVLVTGQVFFFIIFSTPFSSALHGEKTRYNRKNDVVFL